MRSRRCDAAVGQRREDPVGVDPTLGVAGRRERPVVVAVRVGLLELDDRGRPARARAARRTGRGRRRRCPARTCGRRRGTAGSAPGRRRRSSAGRGSSPSSTARGRRRGSRRCRYSRPAARARRPARRARPLEVGPARCAALGIGPVRDAERADVAAGGDAAGRRRPVDRPRGTRSTAAARRPASGWSRRLSE